MVEEAAVLPWKKIVTCDKVPMDHIRFFFSFSIDAVLEDVDIPAVARAWNDSGSSSHEEELSVSSQLFTPALEWAG